MGGIDTYAYVEGNPLTRVDVMGLRFNPHGSAGHGDIVGDGPIPEDFWWVADTPSGPRCGCGSLPDPNDDADFYYTPEDGWTKLWDGEVRLHPRLGPIGGMTTTPNYGGRGDIIGFLTFAYDRFPRGHYRQTPKEYLRGLRKLNPETGCAYLPDIP